MDMPKHLLAILLLAISLFAAKPVETQQGCSNFQFSVEINKEENGSLHRLTINASGGKMPYNFLLLNDKNTLISTKFSENVFNGLKQGRYRCIVADKDDCSLEKFIDVK